MTAIATPASTGAAPLPVAALDERSVRVVWSWLVGGTAALAAVYGLVGPRTATFGRSPFGQVPTSALQQLVSLAGAALAVGVVVLALPLAVRRPALHGRGALLGLAAAGGSVLVSNAFNDVRFNVGLVALPALALAVLAFPRPKFSDLERIVRGWLRAFVWSSVVAGLLAPGWATGPLTATISFGSRLAGTVPHPNALGPLCVALLVLEWSRRPRHVVPIAVALGALVWTHSRTSWAALALVVAVGVLRRGRLAPAASLVARLVLAAFVVAVLTIAFGLSGSGRATVKGDDRAATFTGRTAIWEATVEVWAARPLLGVGSRLWDDDMDRRFASRVGFAPGHAHNQLVHTLGESGVVGLLALVSALVGLAGLAGRGDERSGGASTGLFVALVVTSFSEPPIRSVPFSTSYFLVLITVALLFVAANEEVAPDG